LESSNEINQKLTNIGSFRNDVLLNSLKYYY